MRYLESLNRGLHDVMQTDNKVVVLGEDILDPYGGAFKVTKGLSTAFPERVLTTPISEAGLVGVCIGLGMSGFKPIGEIMFGDFITLAIDQLVNSAAKFNWMYNEEVRIAMVVRVPMGGYRGYGPTHSQSLESLLLSIPGLEIVCPNLFSDPGGLLEKSVYLGRPVIFIEHKILYSRLIYPKNVEGFALNPLVKTVINENGWDEQFLTFDPQETADITIIAYGEVANLAISVAEKVYLEEEITVGIFIPTSLNSGPSKESLAHARETGLVLIIEEGVRNWGWGTEISCRISETIFDNLKKPVQRIGAKQHPIPSSPLLEAATLPSAKDIETAIYEMI